jgi:hypothetical protein
MTETQPSDLLMGFVVSLLTPFLMSGGITDAGLARRAAEETIAAYRAAGQDQIVSIAQIVGFALTSLDNLRLSLPAELSLSMKLKLRGNANALSRSSRHATATLDRQRRDAPEPEVPVVVEAAVVRRAEVIPMVAGSAERAMDLGWAEAMTDVAAEFTAELGTLAPGQRRTQMARIGALSVVARALGQGDAPALRARLLGSTSLRG